MIGKKVANPKKSASKATRVGQLAEYIREPEQRSKDEKYIYAGANGFLSDDAKAQQLEMLALAMEAPRSKDPINHYVLSWREGEQPTPRQCDEAVGILLKELGLEGHQVIYGLHSDTDNLHLHVMVNRVHPETERVILPHNGFDIEALHRAVARIEHEQGWERESHGRYVVEENGEILRVGTEQRIQPTQKARDMELLTGQKSAQRTGIETVPEIVKSATGWAELHERLAEAGMRYERKGSGALLYIDDQPIKASTADRNASLAKLEKRFGPFEAAAARLEVKEREIEPLRPESVPKGWGDYAKARREHYEQKNAARDELSQVIDTERKQLAERQKQERKDTLSGRWRGKGAELNTMRSVLAAQQAAEKAELQDRHVQARAQVREQFKEFPYYEKWLAEERNPSRAQEWRYGRDQVAGIEGPGHDRGQPQKAVPADIRAFVHEIHGESVYYSRRAGQGAGGVSFVDSGPRINIYDWRSQDCLLAALQLSAQKWGGGFTVTGNDEYKAACVRLAAEHGFKIVNPELQQGIQAERQRLQLERAEAMKAPQLQQFNRYHEAVEADRYRVTSIKMLPDGEKKTFILDKRDGATRGFTPVEIAQRTPEMLRLQRRGENIYYTPLSEKQHHILVDDMDRPKLDRLIADGYKPAAVIESSPGNYQAILTVPKLGTAHDREVGNRLAEQLNREYGDPKLSGCVHPHRAPGYENRKPKHEREDGTYPEVRLLKAERRQCDKSLELSRVIDTEYARQAAKQAKEAVQLSPVAPPKAEQGIFQVYDAHRADILARQKGEIDYSRLDSMIALRMRVTGHDQAAIQAAIRDGAPRSRPLDSRGGHQWDDYARRTANSAYTPRADRQAESLAPKYTGQWARLEGRELEFAAESRLVVRPLTEKEFKMLAQAESVPDAMHKAMVEEKEIAIMGGRGKAGYDQDSKQFYASLKKEDQPTLERQMTSLAQTQREIEHEIEGFSH
ncbi:MAG: TraI/MobA(P) family conjugative relaxase [Terracidiphilus sp.]